MANATSTFNESFLAAFLEIAEAVKSEFGVYLQVAEILGKRWSFVAGEPEGSTFLPSKRLMLNEHLGLIAENWEVLPREKQEEILSVLREKLAVTRGM
ncbi:MAG: hypothetical protein GXO76_14900 [Calditrichaeota bacterium]|nr:hypothetical protein [Calditrichota bacterium]